MYRHMFLPGDVTCSECKYKFPFASVEYFFQPSVRGTNEYMKRSEEFHMSKQNQSHTDFPWNINSEIISIKYLSDTQITHICGKLDIHNITVDQMKESQIYCDLTKNTMYFPMIDVGGKIIGYKTLFHQMEELCEESFPTANAFGAVVYPARKQQKTNRTAILVSNLLDYLSLIRTNVTRMYSSSIIHTIHKLFARIFE